MDTSTWLWPYGKNGERLNDLYFPDGCTPIRVKNRTKKYKTNFSRKVTGGSAQGKPFRLRNSPRIGPKA